MKTEKYFLNFYFFIIEITTALDKWTKLKLQTMLTEREIQMVGWATHG